MSKLHVSMSFLPGSRLSDRIVFFVLLFLQLVWSIFVNPHGYLIWDSGTYLMMMRNFVLHGSFIMQNGLADIPSPEWAVGQLQWVGGHLVSQYPEFYTLFSMPAYLLLGWSGVFLQNALLFMVILVLVWNICWLLTGNAEETRRAVLLYLVGTFAWEYSQSESPHMAATFLTCLAAYAALWALRTTHFKSGISAALLAGMVMGIGVGVRLDTLFAASILFIPPLLSRPVRWRLAAASAVGMAIPLFFLALINLEKFGIFNPLAYGAERTGNVRLSIYIPLLLGGLAFFIAIGLALHRPRYRKVLAGSFVALAALSLLFSPLAREVLWKFLDGSWQILVDMRIRSMDIAEAALSRTESGGMIYMGAYKKALLQSCPWLALLFVCAVAALKHPFQQWKLLWLLLIPVSFLTPFSWLAWHGSVACNMRYLNTILPFLAIAGALAWSKVKVEGAMSFYRTGLIVIAMILTVFCSAYKPLAEVESVHLDFPLALAALVFLFSAVAVGENPLKLLTGKILRVLLVASVAWSGAILFLHDYTRSVSWRERNLVLAKKLEPLIPERSLIITSFQDAAWGLMEKRDDLLLAYPLADEYQSLPTLVQHAISKDYHIFFLFNDYETALINQLPIRTVPVPLELNEGLILSVLPGKEPVAPNP